MPSVGVSVGVTNPPPKMIPVRDGLIVWLRTDHNFGSLGGAATLYGGASQAAGKFSFSAAAGQSGSIAVANSAAWSFAARFKQAATGGAANPILLGLAESTGLIVYSGKYQLIVQTVGFKTSGVSENTSSHTVVVTHAGTTTSLYFDGVSVGSVTGTPVAFNRLDLNRDSSGNALRDIAIWHPAVWDRELSSGEAGLLHTYYNSLTA